MFERLEGSLGCFALFEGFIFGNACFEFSSLLGGNFLERINEMLEFIEFCLFLAKPITKNRYGMSKNVNTLTIDILGIGLVFNVS